MCSYKIDFLLWVLHCYKGLKTSKNMVPKSSQCLKDVEQSTSYLWLLLTCWHQEQLLHYLIGEPTIREATPADKFTDKFRVKPTEKAKKIK